MILVSSTDDERRQFAGHMGCAAADERFTTHAKGRGDEWSEVPAVH